MISISTFSDQDTRQHDRSCHGTDSAWRRRSVRSPSNICEWPPPIFVSGPSGTGKTLIVRNVLDILKWHYASDCVENSTKRVIGSAYVNCATVEPSSLEAVLESAYSQLASSLELPQRVRKAKRKKDSSTVGWKERKNDPLIQNRIGFGGSEIEWCWIQYGQWSRDRGCNWSIEN